MYFQAHPSPKSSTSTVPKGAKDDKTKQSSADRGRSSAKSSCKDPDKDYRKRHRSRSDSDQSPPRSRDGTKKTGWPTPKTSGSSKNRSSSGSKGSSSGSSRHSTTKRSEGTPSFTESPFISSCVYTLNDETVIQCVTRPKPNLPQSSPLSQPSGVEFSQETPPKHTNPGIKSQGRSTSHSKRARKQLYPGRFSYEVAEADDGETSLDAVPIKISPPKTPSNISQDSLHGSRPPLQLKQQLTCQNQQLPLQDINVGSTAEISSVDSHNSKDPQPVSQNCKQQ